jgi:hypothetical protein
LIFWISYKKKYYLTSLFAFFNAKNFQSIPNHTQPHPSMSAIFPKNHTSFVIEKAATTPSLAKKEGIGLIDPTADMRRWDVSDPKERLLEN